MFQLKEVKFEIPAVRKVALQCKKILVIFFLNKVILGCEALLLIVKTVNKNIIISL